MTSPTNGLEAVSDSIFDIFEGSSSLKAVEINPDRVVLLDINEKNPHTHCAKVFITFNNFYFLKKLSSKKSKKVWNDELNIERVIN